ncbi:hypothetical protein BC938DRAFT_482447 [Jimgerdemannia flammicorona]|uniref:Uncharacterized protein n=1 Tax=Jimgerdemannia flammicorona TaxID=994334 RepID=A0A433QE41_9FUNG|nr:hypothetical protein BC938DRAFT_482447 [Jimgerdemannia flammicorona]
MTRSHPPRYCLQTLSSHRPQRTQDRRHRHRQPHRSQHPDQTFPPRRHVPSFSGLLRPSNSRCLCIELPDVDAGASGPMTSNAAGAMAAGASGALVAAEAHARDEWAELLRRG